MIIYEQGSSISDETAQIWSSVSFFCDFNLYKLFNKLSRDKLAEKRLLPQTKLSLVNGYLRI